MAQAADWQRKGGPAIELRILIAEDDGALAGFVRKGLEAEYYAVDVSAANKPVL
jgi:hypothetical protein